MLKETATEHAPTTMGTGQATEPRAGSGWIAFAGSLLLISGAFMLIDGIAAVANSKFYVADATYVFGDLNAWGWTLIVLGGLKLLVGAGVFARNTAAVVTAIVIAGASIIGEMLAASRYPLWSLVVIALDVLIVYGLFTHGFEEE